MITSTARTSDAGEVLIENLRKAADREYMELYSPALFLAASGHKKAASILTEAAEKLWQEKKARTR